MKDKEKQKEDLTSFSLTIAILIFAFLGYFTFVAFLSTKPENETMVDWLLKFMDRYGSFLASIPVLFAVLVAKQQLDANRRQHVATVKRSLKKELDAIEEANVFCQTVMKTRLVDISNPHEIVNVILDKDVVRDVFNKNTLNTLWSTQHYINNATSNLEGLQSNKQELLTQAQEEAKNAISLIAEFESNLSQYWS